jgi:geranylgeranyl diphosphate synthase type I
MNMSLSHPVQPSTADPGDLTALLTHYGTLVRAELSDLVQGSADLAGFYGMMAYHLGWVDSDFAPRPARAGKSLRPGLCLLMAQSLGAAVEDAVALAAGIELLHNFSLIHDDIEDRSTTRRGRPTVWSLWGEAQAINAGDGMLALAHLAWLRSPLAGRDPTAFLITMRSLEETILRLCEGQFLDIGAEGSLALTIEQYLAMIGRKTAALIGESACAGARVAAASPAVLEGARAFGRELGLAFQIRDDLLGIWGDEQLTGKSASSDIATRKMTLPVIIGLVEGPDAQREALRTLYSAPPRYENDEVQVRSLLEAAGADRRAAGEADAHWQMAMDALGALPISPAWREVLVTYARWFVERTA